MTEDPVSRMPLVFTTPVLGHPAIGGPELRIRNTIQALARVSQLHVVRRLGPGIAAAAYPSQDADDSAYGQLAARLATGLSERELEGARRPFMERAMARVAYRLGSHEIAHAKQVAALAEGVGAEIVWCGFGNISYRLIRALKHIAPRLRLVCDTDSVWSRFVLRELPIAKPTRKPGIALRGLLKQLEEKRLTRLADLTTAVSEIDADYYRHIASDSSRVRVFSNVIDMRSYMEAATPPMDFSKPAIFLGGSFYSVNSPMADAARWLISAVMPLVWKRLPDCRLYLVGKGSDAIEWVNPFPLRRDRLVATGEVASVLPYLQNSDVAVVPLHFESGTRFKILEAGACRVPVVSTRLGAEGLPVVGGVHALLADEPDDFAAGIIRVIEDTRLSRALSDACYTLVAESYTIEALAEQAGDILQSLRRGAAA